MISGTCNNTIFLGETALHLAARYARADAAKRLLDAGADANMKDATGRTPLHAAISADAQGVFQILLRNRATELDARWKYGLDKCFQLFLNLYSIISIYICI